jgi:hypothetical protein
VHAVARRNPEPLAHVEVIPSEQADRALEAARCDRDAVRHHHSGFNISRDEVLHRGSN